MKTKRIKINDIDEAMMESIKNKYDLTNEQVISNAINYYYIKLNTNEEIDYKQDQILEYVKLLVKANKELPMSNETEKMETIVNLESRFQKIIEDKISKK